MAVPKNFITEKGTELPLLNLRGKPYLQVAHRLVWMTEKFHNYKVDTNFLKLEEDYAIARTEITIFNEDGSVLKSASATKKETKKDFPDFVEKAETGSMGRALASLGVGTQFCTQDLDEGNRLADSPIPPAKKTGTGKSTFSNKPTTKKETKQESSDDGWE